MMGSFPPEVTVTKTGWVSEYTLRLPPLGIEMKDDYIFFAVTIVEGGPTGGNNPVTFKLSRGIPKDLADKVIPGDAPLTMSYGSVEMGLIATLKDAYLNGKRVIVDGNERVDGNKTKYNRLVSVTIKEMTGRYTYFGIAQDTVGKIPGPRRRLG